MKRLAGLCLLALLLALRMAGNASAQPVEVLHYWTSTSETAALDVIKNGLAQKGLVWKDFVIPGGGGESAYAVLQARAIAGDPPVAALLEGPTVQEWASLGFLASPYPASLEKSWDAVLPQVVQQAVKYKGRYVALPTNIHRINWLWVNTDVLAAVGAAPPKTWDDFFVLAPKLKAAGYTPLLLGNEPWQEGTLFEAFLLGMSDAAFYRQVFVEHNSDAILSSRMQYILERFRALRPYTGRPDAGKSWTQTIAALRQGKAAMLVMGDWAKAELQQQGMSRQLDCVPAPGTASAFIYGVDSFALLHAEGEAGDNKVQAQFAAVLMSPALQSRLAQRKGAIPPRRDADRSKLDRCGQASYAAFAAAEKNRQLLPSMAHSMAGTQVAREAIFRVVSHYFNHPQQDSGQATQQLNAALQALQQ